MRVNEQPRSRAASVLSRASRRAARWSWRVKTTTYTSFSHASCCSSRHICRPRTDEGAPVPSPKGGWGIYPYPARRKSNLPPSEMHNWLCHSVKHPRNRVNPHPQSRPPQPAGAKPNSSPTSSSMARRESRSIGWLDVMQRLIQILKSQCPSIFAIWSQHIYRERTVEKWYHIGANSSSRCARLFVRPIWCVCVCVCVRERERARARV